jgi:RNA polymerase sigma-70 factor, ECF subfamily
MIAASTRRQIDGSRTAPAALSSVEDVALPHVDAAYRLARWRLCDELEAEEVVQESVRRALHHIGTFEGGDGRAWFLRIVNAICHDRRLRTCAAPHGARDARLRRADEASSLEDAIGSLPDHLREVLVLRELEGLSFRELAEVMDVSVETAVSRLSHARQALSGLLFRSLATV